MLIRLFFLSALALAAQTITATLETIVLDSSGALIPGAKVRIVNAGTSAAVSLETNAEGRALAVSLQPGAYSIEVEAQGFKKLQRSGVVLQVNQSARLELRLDVGAVTDTIVVTGEPPLLEPSSSAIGQVVNNKRVTDLPLNQRNAFALVFLVPGVTGNTSFNFLQSTNFSINGGRHASNEVLLDGVPSAPSQDQKSIVAIFPSIDAVEEFKVQTNSYSAEFGRSGGGVVNLIFKSGTNQYRGSLFEFLRNSVLDSNGFFANRQGLPLTSFKRNQFGVSFGGPVYIPGVYKGKNRTFFFADYEGLRERTAATLVATMPNANVRAGNFSQSRNGSNQAIVVYDPATTIPAASGFTRQPFAGNVIPAARMDPVARNLLKYYPEPNAAGLPYSGLNNYFATAATLQTSDQGDIKVDHNFNERHRIFGRYSRRWWEIPPNNFFPEQYRVGESGSLTATNNNAAVLDYTWTKSAALLLNFRYGYTRMLWLSTPRSLGFDVNSLGFPPYLAAVAALPVMPSFGPADYYRIGHGNALSAGRVGTDIHTWLGSATRITTRHAFKFGGEVRSFYQNTSQNGRATGDYSFGREFTQGPDPLRATATAGEGFASFLLGLGSGTQTQGFKIVSTQNSYLAGYASDDLKASRKLTLNLGVRWEVEIPRTERYNRTNIFDRTIPHPLAGPTGIAGLRGGLVFVGVDGFSRRPIYTDWNNFSPRIGFAYQINANTVLRGACGIFYAPSAAQGTGTIGQTGYRADTPFRGTVDGATPYAYLRNPFPDSFLPVTGSTLGLMTFVGQGISATLRDTASTYTQNWNLSLQHKLPGGIVVDSAYVASRGIQLVDTGITMNQLPLQYWSQGAALLQAVPNPFYGLISSGPLAGQTVQRRYLLRPYPHFDGVGAVYYTGASSIYHSFQLKAEKRYQQGVTFLVAYTNSKAMDDASQTDGNVGREGTRQNYFDRRSERSLSTYDVSQRMVVSFGYELPFGTGKFIGGNWSRPMQAVFGGWQVNSILTFQRGLPLTLSTANTTQAFNPGLRPNNSGQSAELPGSVSNRLLRYFDTTVFSQPANYTLGNVGRTLPDIRGDGMRNVEFWAFKQFRATERVLLQFRAEFFNLMNTPQFGMPGTALNSAGAFGVISSQANTPRQVQFGMKLIF